MRLSCHQRLAAHCLTTNIDEWTLSSVYFASRKSEDRGAAADDLHGSADCSEIMLGAQMFDHARYERATAPLAA